MGFGAEGSGCDDFSCLIRATGLMREFTSPTASSLKRSGDVQKIVGYFGELKVFIRTLFEQGHVKTLKSFAVCPRRCVFLLFVLIEF